MCDESRMHSFETEFNKVTYYPTGFQLGRLKWHMKVYYQVLEKLAGNIYNNKKTDLWFSYEIQTF